MNKFPTCAGVIKLCFYWNEGNICDRNGKCTLQKFEDEEGEHNGN